MSSGDSQKPKSRAAKTAPAKAKPTAKAKSTAKAKPTGTTKTTAKGKTRAKAKPPVEATTTAKAKSPARAKAKPRASARSKRRARSAADGSLVVGYDGSETARAAVDWAARALGPGGKIVLVYAAQPQHSRPEPLSSAKDRRRYGQALLDELLLEEEPELLDRLGPVVVVEADPVTALTGAAEQWDAQGIVVGSNDRSRLRKALGTVTSELLSRSKLPVTVVPPPARAG